MTPELILEVTLKVWDGIQKLRALSKSRESQGLPPLTEAEARAELSTAISDLDRKILADQAAHPLT
ncbi:MAG: hypothetical protein WAY02_07385 [Burkholderiaceae bacterium]